MKTTSKLFQTNTKRVDHATNFRVERRKLLKSLPIAIAAGVSTAGLAPTVSFGAQSDVTRHNAKLVFVLFRRAGLSHDQCLAEWNGEMHTSIVRRVPGLKKWVQNHVFPSAADRAADGIGELWFDSSESMTAALKSPEMGAASEDAKRFLDMERTYAIVVEEKTIIA